MDKPESVDDFLDQPVSPTPSRRSQGTAYSYIPEREGTPDSQHYDEISVGSFDSKDDRDSGISMDKPEKEPPLELNKIDEALSLLRESLESKQRKTLEHRLAKTLHYYKQQVHEMRELRAQWESNAERLVIAEKDCARHKRKREEALQTIEEQNETIARLEQQVTQLTAEEKGSSDLKESAKQLLKAEKKAAKYKRKRDEAMQRVEDKEETIGRLEQQVKLLTTGQGFWPGLEVRASKIPGAGDGLYTKHPIPKGVIIGEYYGDPVYRMEIDDDSHVVWRKDQKGPVFMKDDTYVVWIKEEVKRDGVWIKINTEKGVDGDRRNGHEEKTILRKMNHSEKNNTAHFVCEDGTVKFYTTRPIEADEELLWDYDEEIETDFEKGVKKRIIQEPKKYVRVVDGKVTLKKAKRSPFNVKNFILQ